MFTVGRCFAPILAVLTITAPAAAGTAASAASRDVDRSAAAGLLLEEQRGHIVIVELLPGTAAAAAGLRRGDVVLAVNGVNLIDLEVLSAAAVADLIAGDAESDITLIIGRKGQTLDVELSRALIDDPPGLARPPQPPVVGEQAPAFTATDMQGRSVRLEDLRGRPLIIDFWASWCPPCRASAITLKRFADQFGDRLAIVGVSLDEDRGDFEAFVYNHHLPGYQVHDGGPSGPITTLYGAADAGVPYSVLVDPEGEVLHVGASLKAKEQAISRILEAAAHGEGN
jgi:thiol-disulfide isomerase/thioredoxin